MTINETLISLDAYLNRHTSGDVVAVYESGTQTEKAIQLIQPDLTVEILRKLKDSKQPVTLAELDTKYSLGMTAAQAFGVFGDLERLAQLGALEIKAGESGRHSRILKLKEPRLALEALRVDNIHKKDYSRVIVKLASAK